MSYPEIKQAEDLDGWNICGGSGVYNGRDAEKAVWGGPLKRPGRAEMFLYLFRRFGYPRWGWDDYKSLANYTLTTPDPDVVVWISPPSIGFGLSPDFLEEAYAACYAWREQEPRVIAWEQHPIYQRIHTAVCAALGELVRPVNIRDVHYTVAGEAGDGSVDYDQRATPSAQAGFGLGEFDPALAWQQDERKGALHLIDVLAVLHPAAAEAARHALEQAQEAGS